MPSDWLQIHLQHDYNNIPPETWRAVFTGRLWLHRYGCNNWKSSDFALHKINREQFIEQAQE